GKVSLMDEVLERARSNAGPTLDLAGGYEVSPGVFEGEVVGVDGRDVPSVSLEVGLMTASPLLYEATRSLLLDSIVESSGDAPGLLSAGSGSEAGLLLEVITAHYDEARTHVRPGDRSRIDLSGVDGLVPGDDVGIAYIFGQTIPGDPEVEEGLSGFDLFRYRWDRGLIRVLGRDGVVAYADEAVTVVDNAEALALPQRIQVAYAESPQTASSDDDSSGTAVLDRETKEALLGAAGIAGFAEGFGSANDVLEQTLEGAPWEDSLWGDFTGRVEIFVGEEQNVILYNEENESWIVLESVPCGDYDTCTNVKGRGTSREAFVLFWAARLSLDRCVEVASELNRRNAAGADLTSSANAESTRSQGAGEGQGRDAEDDASPDDPGDALDPQPSPVGCVPPPDGNEFPPRPPRPPTGDSVGDIHIKTIDGNRYSNQAAGEFLLFENQATTIQVRTEPWGDSDVVSVATAFAFTIGDHMVSVHAGGETRMDGATVELERGVPLSVGGGELLWWHGGWVVVWPDGTIMRVHEREVALVASVTPSEGPTTGLFGDNDGNPDNDLFTRDGNVLDPNADDDFVSFYSTYVDSWRITDEESLFNYDEGETTDTFTIEGFPAEPVDADDLPADLFAQAQVVCTEAGVTAGEVLDNCIVDVAMTGDPMFAYDAYLVQEPVSEFEGDGGGSDAPTANGDATNTLTLGDLTIVFGANPPVQDPGGPAPSWTCESADGVYTAISSFQETPTIRYGLDIQYIGPDNSRGLDSRFRLIVTRNSEPYAWVQTNAEQFSDSVDSISVEGSVLTASGKMFVNDPPEPGLQPISPLPPDAVLDRFQLSVSCEG
ncbi:MAG: VWD domain-containing protein, partial [Acidimicrobiia bacterium]